MAGSSGLCRVLSGALAAVAIACALPSASAMASPAAPVRPRGSAEPAAVLPSGLRALERKMLALKIGSERVAVAEVVRGPELKGPLEVIRKGGTRARGGHGRRHRKASSRQKPAPIRSFTFVRAVAEIATSPEVMLIHGRIFGKIRFQERKIGEALYIREPLLTSKDAGRPWVYASPSELREEERKLHGRARAERKQTTRQVIEAPLRDLVKLLGRARSVQRVGAARVRGRRTIEFLARLDPRRLLHQIAGEGLGMLGSAKARRRLAHARATLRVFIAPDGLPLRLNERLRTGRQQIEERFDILATEIPVSAAPPPASETITRAELRKLQESESASRPPVPTKRQRMRMKRYEHCLRSHLPKHIGRLRGSARWRATVEASRKCEHLTPSLSNLATEGAVGESKQ